MKYFTTLYRDERKCRLESGGIGNIADYPIETAGTIKRDRSPFGSSSFKRRRHSDRKRTWRKVRTRRNASDQFQATDPIDTAGKTAARTMAATSTIPTFPLCTPISAHTHPSDTHPIPPADRLRDSAPLASLPKTPHPHTPAHSSVPQ